MTQDKMSTHYQTLPIPISRRMVEDAGRLARQRSLIHGLLELDVTAARESIRQHKAKTGESLSFTAFLVACLAKAIEANPLVQGHRNWRNQLIVFKDVDVVTLIEPEAGATAFPHILRAANHKTFRQIHDEIRAVQARPAVSTQKSGALVRLGPYAPTSIRMAFYRAMLMNPHWMKKFAGTVTVTAVGMFGQGGGWGMGFAPFHTLSLTVGGISVKPAFVNGQLVPREYLCVTISLDHLVIDGAPAARFASCFKQLVESRYGLTNL